MRHHDCLGGTRRLMRSARTLNQQQFHMPLTKATLPFFPSSHSSSFLILPRAMLRADLLEIIGLTMSDVTIPKTDLLSLCATCRQFRGLAVEQGITIYTKTRIRIHHLLTCSGPGALTGGDAALFEEWGLRLKLTKCVCIFPFNLDSEFSSQPVHWT